MTTTASDHGQVALFAELVREHQAGVRSYVRSLGVDEIWVDDLAQEVFLVAYRRQTDFRANADYGKWLRGIARHLVANERRKTARRSRLINEGITDLLLAFSPGSASDYNSAFERLGPAMEDCIGQLPPRFRDLLDRRYARRETASSMARGLRLSAEAVRQQLRRVRLAVKDCVERKIEELWP